MQSFCEKKDIQCWKSVLCPQYKRNVTKNICFKKTKERKKSENTIMELCDVSFTNDNEQRTAGNNNKRKHLLIALNRSERENTPSSNQSATESTW